MGLAIASPSVAQPPQGGQGQGLDGALETAKKAGLPTVILATRASNPNCVALKTRMAAHLGVNQLLTQFVPYEVDLDGPEAAAVGRYNVNGTALPYIYIISAEGEQLAGLSGITNPEQLAAALRQAVAMTGGPKPTLMDRAAISQRAQQAATRIEAAIEAESYDKALKLLEPYLPKPATESLVTLAAKAEPRPSPADTAPGGATPLPGVTLPGATGGRFQGASANNWGQLPDSLVPAADKLFDYVKEKIDPAATAIGTDRTLLGLVNLFAIDRTWGKLPPVRAEVLGQVARAHQEPSGDLMVAQAERIDQARAEEERKQPRRALAIYKAIVKEWPDSQAAKLCEARITQIEGNLR